MSRGFARRLLARLPGRVASRGADLEQACRMRRQHVVAVEQPLALISQVQRSGGTLLAQLFSGHPQCHVHPGEIQVGFPKKELWPDLDLGEAPERWLARLREKRTAQYARDGFIKVPPGLRARYAASEIAHPFVFVPSLQREIFLARARGAASQRQVLDAYLTSYFNAWLDYQNLYAPDARYAVGFVPRLAARADSVERFFRDYPDGRLVSILRDPESWFVSWQRKKPRAGRRPEQAIPLWSESARAMLENLARHGPERVRLLGFDALLRDTEETLRGLAAWLGIDWDPILMRPTFQTLPIRANSSERAEREGLLDTPLARGAALSQADRETLRTGTADLYERVMAEIDAQPGWVRLPVSP